MSTPLAPARQALPPRPAEGDLAQTRRAFADWQAHAARQGLALRAPPPEPTTCCGRGCNGCVWEGYYDAARFWFDDAAARLAPG